MSFWQNILFFWAYGINLSEVRRDLRHHLILREGKRNKVYKDSLGYPTVGVGHLVLESDGLKVGDEITDELVEMFLIEDSEKALRKAITQARELGKMSHAFIVALGSVNFQLGDFKKVFPISYMHLKQKHPRQAVRNIKRSKWARQTPVRVEDFIDAIKTAYPDHFVSQKTKSA